MKKVLSIFLAVCILMGLLCLPAGAEAADDWDKIRLYETSDIHGWIMSTSSGDPATYDYRMARIAYDVNLARNDPEYDDVILLDGGDMFQGPPISNLNHGAAIRAAMDLMDYDAVALGNHEFDWDVTVYAADDKATLAPYEMGDYKGDSDIPVVSSNFYYAGTDRRVNFTKDYTMLEKAGYKIAVIGYSPDYSPAIMAAKIAPYKIDADIGRLKEKIAEIKAAEKPDVTILLTHEGAPWIAPEFTPDEVDVVCCGHSHQFDAGVTENGVAYLQGGAQANGYAYADIEINSKTGEVRIANPSYEWYYPDAFQPAETDKFDPQIKALSDAAWKAIEGQMNEVLGTVDHEISGFLAGDWLSSLMVAATADLGTEFAFINPGGIRTWFTIEEGQTTRPITVGDMYAISPFSNHIMTYDITGAELAEHLAKAAEDSDFGSYFTGLRLVYEKQADETEKLVTVLLDDGRSVDLTDTEQTYRVSTNEFCATRIGSIFKDKTPVQNINDAPLDNDGAIEALREIGKQNNGVLPLFTGKRIFSAENLITVTFTDAEGNVLEARKLTEDCPCGAAPAVAVPEGYVLKGWVTEDGTEFEENGLVAASVEYHPVFEEKQSLSDRFTDVEEGSWYYDDVAFMYDHGLMLGVSADAFGVHEPLTRAELVTILFRYADEKVSPDFTNPFTDVKADEWYTDAVLWAAENGVVFGDTETTFAPDDPITREQVVTILHRYLKEPEAQKLPEVADWDDVSEYAEGAMAWANESEILLGNTDDGTLRLYPQDHAERVQAAAIMARFILSRIH